MVRSYLLPAGLAGVFCAVFALNTRASAMAGLAATCRFFGAIFARAVRGNGRAQGGRVQRHLPSGSIPLENHDYLRRNGTREDT